MASPDNTLRRNKVLDSRVVSSMPGNGNNHGLVISFGIFEVDMHAGELRRSGMRVRLQEQPFQVLKMLLERPGEVVTREALQTQLWSADTFVDFDHSLNAAIKRLREALGDSAENPRFVETLSRKGYRFVAPVNRPLTVPAPESPSPVSMPRPRYLWAAGIVASGLLVLGIFVGLYVGHRSVPAPQARPFRLTATPEDDPVNGAAISPDGKYLAYADNNGFYLRQVDTGETHPIPLPRDFAARPGSWYPDSNHMVVAVPGKETERPGLYEISVFGGSPRLLFAQGWQPAVSPDGSEIVFITGSYLNEQLWMMRSDGSQPHKLLGDPNDFFGSVAWSPDGTRIAYTAAHFVVGIGTKSAIEIFNPSTPKRQIMMAPPRIGQWIAWTADNRLIYSLEEPSPNQSDSNLWAVQLNSNGEPSSAPVQLTSEAGAVGPITLAAGGKRLAFVKKHFQPDVYVANLEDRGLRIGEPQRLTFDDHDDYPYDWTPDSKAIIFASDRSGTFKIYKQGIDQTTPDLVVSDTSNLAIPRLSPDGTEVLYEVYSTKWEPMSHVRPIMRVPLAGGAPQKVLEAMELMNHQCARAPSTVCVYSQAEKDALAFFTFDPVKGNPKQILRIKDDLPYSYGWSLSPNGAMLAVAKGLDLPNESIVRIFPLDGSAEKLIHLRGYSGIYGMDWAGDSKSLRISGHASDDENRLLNVGLDGRVTPLLLSKNMEIGWAIPSPDGKKIAIWQASGTANVWMLENF